MELPHDRALGSEPIDKPLLPFSSFREEVDSLAAFHSQEDLEAKLEYNQMRERAAPYEHAIYPPYLDRVDEACALLPRRFRGASRALFANAVYLPTTHLEETTRTLARDIASWSHERGIQVPDEVHVFALDHPRLWGELYEVGSGRGWTSRNDRIPQKQVDSVSDLLTQTVLLAQASLDGQEGETDDVQRIREVLSKKVWVVLTDSAMSGGSLTSEVRKLEHYRNLLSPHRASPTILVAAQIMTRMADATIRRATTTPPPLYGLMFDDRFRISSDSCALFGSHKTLEHVRALCEWFGDRYFLPPDQGKNDKLRKTLVLHRKAGGQRNFAFGWKDCGLTIVTQRNAPTDTVPILWYPLVGDTLELVGAYVPPFPRNHSRDEQLTAGDDKRLKYIAERQERLRGILLGFNV